MSAIFLLPGLLSLYLVIRGRIEMAFLSVYLPALLLLPEGYALKFPHLPAISAAESALIPIGAVALYRLLRSGIPSLMDILLSLFIVSITASEVLRERVMNDGIFAALIAFISIFLAYAAGRTLVEPGLRLVTVRRFVILILLLSPLGLYEWRMGQSLYGVVGQRLFNLDSVRAFVQMRSGRGRMAVSFNDAELAGIVFGMTAALNVWLVYLRKWRSAANLGKRLAWFEKYHIPGLLLLLCVFLTQSRGPMLAVGVGYLILQIPKFKSKKSAIVVVAILIAVAGLAGYEYFTHYTNVSDPGAVMNEQQGSALYRRQMNELYEPIVKQGGFLGWGVLSRPILPGMFSIDNEFLLVHLAYGNSGYILFMLIAAESFRGLVVRSWKLETPEDQAFAIVLLAAMTMFWISITTVWMGEQLPQIAFLLIGWSQSILPVSTGPAAATEIAAPSRFAFRRVFS
ncbi:MAG: O-antigen ligase family protein [Terracidiphilus sp.]|jgi:hypothetical protein